MWAAAAAVLALAYWRSPGFFSLDTMINLVERWQGHPATPVVFVMAYSATAILLPYGFFAVASGVLFGFWIGFLLSLISIHLGALISFRLARKYGPVFAPERVKHAIHRIQPRISKSGIRVLFFLRLTRIFPHFVVNCAAGLSGLRERDFLLGTFLGAVWWVAGFTLFADTLWDITLAAQAEGAASAIRSYAPHLTLIGVFAVAAVSVLWIRRHRRRRHPHASVVERARD